MLIIITYGLVFKNETSSLVSENYSETFKSENSVCEISTQLETEDPVQKQVPLQYSEPINNDQDSDSQNSGSKLVTVKHDNNHMEQEDNEHGKFICNIYS